MIRLRRRAPQADCDALAREVRVVIEDLALGGTGCEQRQVQDPTTITLKRDDLPPPLPRPPCRSSGSDDFPTSVRPFFSGTVLWHLDGRQLTLQRDRSTLTLRVR